MTVLKKIGALLCTAVLLLTMILPVTADGAAETDGTGGADSENVTMEKNQNDQFLTLTATDALGRTTTEAGAFRTDRYVGLFYFIWFDRSQKYALDVTDLYYTNPEELFDPRDKTGIAPPGAMYYFNKPLYGYYSSTDKWVIRKHVELFLMAGIDFLAIDLSNDVIYEPALEALLSVLQEYKDAGWNVPKILCYTNLNSGHTVQMLYDFMYKDGRYKDLWFYGPYDKPLMVADRNEITDPALLDFFVYRHAQWPGYEYEFYEDGWPFCDLNRPQRTHENLIGVSVAQHNAYIFSYGVRPDPLHPMPRRNYGRGYTTDLPRNGMVDAILAGANIQEEWDYAISQDPEIVFVTGWNEWATNKRYPESPDQTVAWFVDSFNTEFSRDIEMTEYPGYVWDEEAGKYSEEGYGDNYYCQLADNIRRYKGTPSAAPAPEKSVTVDMTAFNAAQWEGTYTFLNMSVGNEARIDDNYFTPAAVNFIREMRVTNDNEKVYFLIRTDADAVADPSDATLLNILIGTDSEETGFEHFQYRLAPGKDGKASLSHSAEGYNFTETAQADMTVDGQYVLYAVALTDLGLDGQNDFTLRVKCTDSLKTPDKMLNYYVGGEVLPLGRFACAYRGKGCGPSPDTASDTASGTADSSADTTSGSSCKGSLTGAPAVVIGTAAAAAALSRKKKSGKQ